MGIVVMPYHGKMPMNDRVQAHKMFLTGRCDIIVATVAFGMGIDKPDIRFVINYGAPKCIEDYYQQIGRAGRDGLAATCVLIYSQSELANYASGFYTDSLSVTAKEIHMTGIGKMRSFVNSDDCRRVLIMRNFNENPPFDTCKNCDNCIHKRNSTSSRERDFTDEAKSFLHNIQRFPGSPSGKMMDAFIKDIKDGKIQMLARYKTKTKDYLKMMFNELSKKLQGQGYLNVEMKQLQKQGSTYSAQYLVYQLTQKAISVVHSSTAKIVLSIPEMLIEEELKEKENMRRLQEELSQGGIDTSFMSLPDGEAVENELRDATNWVRMLKRYRENGNVQFADAKEELLRRIMTWRQETADLLNMAPENVLKDTLARRIAYSQTCTTESLEKAGIRIRLDFIQKLADVISSSLMELGLRVHVITSQDMVFPVGDLLCASDKIKSLSLSTGKVNAAPVWKLSYEKFIRGETLEIIASTQTKKAVLVTTVIGHLYDAYLYGNPLNFNLLAKQLKNTGNSFPDELICQKLEAATVSLGFDPTSSELSSSTVLNSIPDAHRILQQDSASMSLEDREMKSLWYFWFKTWSLLRSTCTPFSFTSGTTPQAEIIVKKQRTCE